MSENKYPYCIHCDAPIEKIDYTAELDSFEARGGTVITYVKVSAFCHWCGTELYVPAVNDMNKLSRDNAYAAAMKRERAKAKNIGADYAEQDQFICSECGIHLQDWVRIDEDDYEDGIVHEYVFRFCPNCGADMRKETNDGR